jgi:hypothetical protein
MFSIGDRVFHKQTGHVGKVVGYGHRTSEKGYTMTLKVLVMYPQNSNKRGIVEEDAYSVWEDW